MIIKIVGNYYAKILKNNNDTSVQPQTQAMGTVLWEPQEGERAYGIV